MREILPLLIIVTVTIAVMWVVAIPSTAFVVRIHDGIPRTVQGKVTDAFRDVVAEVFRDLNLHTGVIRGVIRGRMIALRFSNDIPRGACQRLRNWWCLSGWPASPN